MAHVGLCSVTTEETNNTGGREVTHDLFRVHIRRQPADVSLVATLSQRGGDGKKECRGRGRGGYLKRKERKETRNTMG